MRNRETRRWDVAPGVRMTAAAVAVIACATACSDAGERRPSPTVTEEGPDRKTVALIEKTNTAMAGSSFAASGSNSAFGGAEQDITWDPAHGLHLAVRADDGTETDMFCRDGKSYISAPLLAETLNSSGQQISVPPELADRYVTVQAKSCDAYFEIPESAERAPDKDTRIEGERSKAVTVDNAGSVDVYHIAASGKPRLLKWDAERDGLETTMTYEGYGEEYRVALPPAERHMKMSDFQEAVLGGPGTRGE